MATTATLSQRLAERILGQPLADYVRAKRTARPRWSWRLIAEQLREDTSGEVDLTGETLRQWFGADELAEAS